MPTLETSSRRTATGGISNTARWIVVGLVAAALPAVAQSAPHRRLTAEERRGKQIYLRGTSSSGRQITALFGDAATEIPASALPCANCHGFDGRGRPEGGVSPSNITWAELTKPYEVTLPGGRKHSAYDERMVRRAVTQGIDPAGNKLSTAMPMYQFTHQEMADLVAFVKRVGRDPDPGLTDDSIALGSLLPRDPRESEVVRSVLAAYFAEINAEGGIHGRNIQLEFAAAGASPEETARCLQKLVDSRDTFALTTSFIAGAEHEVEAFIMEEEIPLVGASTPLPPVNFPLNRYAFYLSPGIKEQARALVSFASGEFPGSPPRARILAPEKSVSQEIAESIEQQCASAGWDGAEVIRYSPQDLRAADLVRDLRGQSVQVLFLLGSGTDQQSIIEESSRQSWRPYIFVPGPLAGREIKATPESFEGRVFLSFPRGPTDQTADGIARFLGFARRNSLGPENLSLQVATYCSAMVLVEALKRTGRDLSREKLTTTLEGLYEFDTGLMPPITFGPNRRIGNLGAYVARFDPQSGRFVPASDWIDAN